MFDTEEIIADRYLVETIVQGHMGIVYLSIDQKTQQPVAIKTFKEEYLNAQENHKQFLQEAVTWIRLGSHPNIVRAYALKLFSEKPHLVLERIFPNNLRGTTLKDYLFTRHVSLEEILQLSISLCEGMIHALNKFPNLVHRDLKPENILIGDDLIPKISDFGMTLQQGIIAGDYGRSTLWDNPNHPSHLARRMLGTPATASPEQCMAEALDTRSDIYSFGCILYQMATKRLPFYGGTVEEYIIAHTCKQAAPPHELIRDFHKGFSSLIMKCLEKEKSKRFQSFNELQSELIDIFENHFQREPYSTVKDIPFTVNDHIDRAESFAVLQEYAEAKEELHKAEELAGSQGIIEYGMGKISLQQKKYNDALSRFQKALEFMPNDDDCLYWLAHCYFKLERLDDAIHLLEKAINEGSTSTTIFRYCANLYTYKRDFHSAIRILKKGLEVCSKKFPLYKLLAKVYRYNNDTSNELQTLQHGLHLEPNDLSIMFRFAEIYQSKHDKRQVLKWTEKIESYELERYEDWYRLGHLYKWLGQLLDCLDAWEQACLYGGGDSKFYVEIANLYRRFRRYREAWSAILQAEKMGEYVDDIKRDIQANISFT